MQAVTSWADVAFSSAERDRHLGSRPVSQLHTWPVVSPVNASRRPSRDAAHHLGSGWLARPSPWGTFTSYSLPANWRTLLRVNNRLGMGAGGSARSRRRIVSYLGDDPGDIVGDLPPVQTHFRKFRIRD